MPPLKCIFRGLKQDCLGLSNDYPKLTINFVPWTVMEVCNRVGVILIDFT